MDYICHVLKNLIEFSGYDAPTLRYVQCCAVEFHGVTHWFNQTTVLTYKIILLSNSMGNVHMPASVVNVLLLVISKCMVSSLKMKGVQQAVNSCPKVCGVVT